MRLAAATARQRVLATFLLFLPCLPLPNRADHLWFVGAVAVVGWFSLCSCYSGRGMTAESPRRRKDGGRRRQRAA